MSIVISIINTYAQERDVKILEHRESKRMKGSYHFNMTFPSDAQANSMVDRAGQGWSQVEISEILCDGKDVFIIAKEKEVQNG